MSTDIPTPRTDKLRLLNSEDTFALRLKDALELCESLEHELAVALARVAELEPNNQRLQEAVDKLLLNSLL